jgi:uncharacterized protein YndB with AHSA1/START domain
VDTAVSAPRFAVSAQVPRPVEEVFDHIVEPGLLSSYFTSEASGPLIVGAQVKWSWEGGESETVDVEEVETNRRVVFRWKAFQVQTRTRVTIALEALEPNRTLVTIEEDGWNEGELASAFEHCAGWEHMLLCLKARMAFGIDLRG